MGNSALTGRVRISYSPDAADVGPAEVRVRVLGIGVLMFSLLANVGNAVAQCPVLPSHASADPNGRTVAIRYHTSGSREVQSVEFTLKGPRPGPNGTAVIARFSARQTLHQRIERTAVFGWPAGKSDGISEAAQVENLEVQVTRVVFTDESTWKLGRADTCKVSFSPR
jgi:hypothetical protein